MQPQNFLGFNIDFIKRNIIPIIFGLCGLILFGYGLIQLLGSSEKNDGIVFEQNDSENKSSSSSAQIVIDVSGAVEKPGVYRISLDSRMQDAILAAGGFSSGADRQWISKNLNLALKVKDGTKIYIPLIGDSAQQNSVGKDGTLGTSVTSLININTASLSELEGLPGIGPVSAQKIVDARQYTSIDELVEKKILTKSVFEKIQEKITVY